ncbi:MAG TPA: DUF2288 domain-containing protein [Oxalobacteraceae bacterium]|jgi:hypothetical protein|nr:DUF2288 domain-containing protein [Oxalobacteraceae bacterium]HCN88806.1 DUF2288 domain-containing protein [Oxalobacteraceae bacterium]
MTTPEEANESLRNKLNSETARMRWKDLLVYFAGGSVIAVNAELDLVDVALHVTQDDKTAVANWMAQEKLGQVSDQQAAAWLESDAVLWTIVVRPWILVQPQKAG